MASGSVAAVEFQAREGHGFSGLFKGADHGLIRISEPVGVLTLRVITLTTHMALGTYPFQMAVKLFRDGIHSGNLLTGVLQHASHDHELCCGRRFCTPRVQICS